jgi:D-beta-D-heptose 7-phosphate kinase / D-beta-D-heptose 1-phosphate adenosyltransferase
MPLKLFDFSNAKLLVIGDIMLDEYWVGETNRISPEAPVPIVLIKNYDYRAGGAANVALNIAAFGCQVDLLGLAGNDQTAKTLFNLINQHHKIRNLVTTTEYQPTINKLRIISNDQQVFRIDREQHFCAKSFNKLVQDFKLALSTNNYNAIVLSDYNKGSLQDPELIINIANKYTIPVIIDPKNTNYLLYKNAYLLTPNLKEFKQMVNVSSDKELSDQKIIQHGHTLIKELNLQALIVTKGKNGINLLTKDYKDQHFKASPHEVFDVTGAGDTVTATIAACLATNNNQLNLATHIATVAAGINVNKLGTSCINLGELQHSLDVDNNHLKLGIIDKEQLALIIKQRQLSGEIIVLINGCFDVLHLGHIQYIKKAKSFGTRLVIAINDDDSIKNLKGNARPINNLEHRMQVLAALKDVDWVVPFNHIRPGNLIELLNPNVLVKTKEAFKTIEEIPEYEGAHHVLKQGGKVYLLDRPLVESCDTSSTKIIEAIKVC